MVSRCEVRAVCAQAPNWKSLEVTGGSIREVEIDAPTALAVRIADARVESITLRGAGTVLVALVRCETSGLSIEGTSGDAQVLVEGGRMDQSTLANGAVMLARWMGTVVGPAVRVVDCRVGVLDLERSQVDGLSLVRVSVDDLLDLTSAHLSNVVLDSVNVPPSVTRYEAGTTYGPGPQPRWEAS